MFNFRLKVLNRSSKCRVFDERIFNLIKKKIIKFPVYLSAGQEYVAATIAEICNLKKIFNKITIFPFTVYPKSKMKRTRIFRILK